MKARVAIKKKCDYGCGKLSSTHGRRLRGGGRGGRFPRSESRSLLGSRLAEFGLAAVISPVSIADKAKSEDFEL